MSDLPDDPYLWLEEVEGARALDWVRAHNARSLALLEADPRYAALLEDARRIATNRDRLALGSLRGGFVYNFWQDEKNVRGLWRRSPLAAYAAGAPVWDVLLDLDALAQSEARNWVFKGVAASPSEARAMISLSDGGKDASIWREFDMASRTFIAGGFVVPEAKSNLAWADEDTLLLATDWGPGTLTESGYAAIAKLWRRGAPMESATEVLRCAPEHVLVSVGVIEDVDGARTLIAQRAETFFEGSTFMVSPDGAAQQLTLPRKASVRGVFHRQLLVTLEEDWARRNGVFPQGALVAVEQASATKPDARVTLIHAPGPRESIEDMAVTKDAVLIAGFHNVRGRILSYRLDGGAWTHKQIGLPPHGSVLFAGADGQESTAFAVFTDFLTPSTLYALDTSSDTARSVRSLPAQFDAAPYVSEQFEAVSKDGTRVPYFVIRAADITLNGENPTLLYGYGGFQVSMTPAYSAYMGKMWLANGGVYVMANIRGGGEFGPAWHQAGLKTKRQVIYDDFAAIAEDLIARKITSPRRLGIQGGSNGGLLMGVLLNQRPELFNAALVEVPLLDMLRYDQLLAGASWVDEYGSPHIAAERQWLDMLSPYHNLKKRPDYPVPFLVTSTKDDRVHPGHARKYAAKLEELGMPFLYYENIDGGHSAAANQLEDARRRALEMTYLLQRLKD